MSADPRPYRPSNGTEGERFQSQFCARCARDSYNPETGDGGCAILADTMAYPLTDPAYPPEWLQQGSQLDGNWQVTCTAFTLRQQVAA